MIFRVPPAGFEPRRRPVQPPDTEWIAQAYLTQFMGDTPVVTRVPDQAGDHATYSAFVRVEAGDRHRVPSLYGAAWDISFSFHSYSPNEIEAAQIKNRASACVCAATGLSIVGWYVITVLDFTGGRRLSEPEVAANIVRIGRSNQERTARHAKLACGSGSGPNLKWRPVISDGVTRT